MRPTPRPRSSFKWPVDIAIDAADQDHQLSEHGESGFWVNTPLQEDSGKVLPGLGGAQISVFGKGRKTRTIQI